jgi:hypothetical protein
MDCTHERKVFCKWRFEKGGEANYHKACQCLDCGQRVKSPTGGIWWPKDYGENVKELPDFDLVLLAKFTDAKMEMQRKEYKNERLQKHEQYEDYLESDEWKHRRELVIERAGGVCESCLERRATQVHHVNYHSLYCEVLWDLRAVCKECHKKIHGLI